MLFYACAAHRFPEPEVPVDKAREDIEALSQNRAFPNSMRLMTKVDYVDELNAKRVVGQDLILSAQAPSNMRITISAFDKAISTLVSDGKGFSLMDVSQNVYITGLATPENIAQILPVYLSASDLYRVIYGLYPVDGLMSDADEKQSFAWDETVGGYKRSLNMKNGLTENVFYDWPDGNIIRITVTNQDETLYIYEASGFKSFNDENDVSYSYPSQILFKLPPQKTDVRLRIENRDVNVDFSPAVFRLLPPNGAKIIVLNHPEFISDDSSKLKESFQKQNLTTPSDALESNESNSLSVGSHLDDTAEHVPSDVPSAQSEMAVPDDTSN